MTEDAPSPSAIRSPVPWRTIWGTIGSVAVVFLGYQAFLATSRIIVWLAVALFFTVVLTPPVDFLVHKARVRRGIAVLLVFLITMGSVGGMLYAFIRPVVDQASNFSSDLPTYVEDAHNGKGWIGDLVRKYDQEAKVKENQDKIQSSLTNLGKPALNFVRSVFSTIIALLTIVVLTFLMLMNGPKLAAGTLALVPDRRRERVRAVAVDSSRAVSGYVFGNLVISVIAGLATWVVMAIMGVPSAEVLGLFVAFTDLIPLIGATLGAVPVIAIAFLHSTPAGIVALIFFIVYQQFENHVLQVTIMSRTVNVNPLTVLVSVLFGVELLGYLGALVAIPVAGVVQVILRDFMSERRGRIGGVIPHDSDATSPTAAAD